MEERTDTDTLKTLSSIYLWINVSVIKLLKLQSQFWMFGWRVKFLFLNSSKTKVKNLVLGDFLAKLTYKYVHRNTPCGAQVPPLLTSDLTGVFFCSMTAAYSCLTSKSFSTKKLWFLYKNVQFCVKQFMISNDKIRFWHTKAMTLWNLLFYNNNLLF